MSHGPRAAVIAPEGRCLVDFDADSLHFREAAFLSQDPFMCEAFARYDASGDPQWKPHVRNTMALFDVTVEQAIEWMNTKAPQYTFSKNFIYMYLNGGDVPALANAAVSAGLVMDEKEVGSLLKSWQRYAIIFEQWRKDLIAEACKTGSVTLPDGRRRRFYDMRWSNGQWHPSKDARKEIYNAPLIGMEVSYTNPRYRGLLDLTQNQYQAWKFVHHEHDGCMMEGPENPVLVELFLKQAFSILEHPFDFGGRKFNCPWDAKWGKCWADLKPWNRRK